MPAHPQRCNDVPRRVRRYARFAPLLLVSCALLPPPQFERLGLRAQLERAAGPEAIDCGQLEPDGHAERRLTESERAAATDCMQQAHLGRRLTVSKGHLTYVPA